MDWIEFLNDPELNAPSSPYGTPNGESLCWKVMHDILECLVTYKECAKIISTLEGELPAENLVWFTKWSMPVENWISEINSLAKRCKSVSAESPLWSEIILQIGVIVEQAPVLEIASQALEIPATGAAKKISEIARHAIQRLSLLRHDIEAHEYKRLWTIRKYGDSTEGKGNV